MNKRVRFQRTSSLEERLSAFAKDSREKAAELPPGQEREELMLKAQRAEDAAKEIAFTMQSQMALQLPARRGGDIVTLFHQARSDRMIINRSVAMCCSRDARLLICAKKAS